MVAVAGEALVLHGGDMLGESWGQKAGPGCWDMQACPYAEDLRLGAFWGSGTGSEVAGEGLGWERLAATGIGNGDSPVLQGGAPHFHIPTPSRRLSSVSFHFVPYQLLVVKYRGSLI